MQSRREEIIRKIIRLDSLPAFPAIVRELDAVLSLPDVSTRKVAAIVEQDAALAARFLKIANSVLFRGVKDTASVSQAAVRIGLTQVREIALATAILGSFGDMGGESPALFWKHSLTVALTARAVVDHIGLELEHEEKEGLFTAGLLHDIGILALYHLYPEDFDRLSDRVRGEHGPLLELEREIWGTDHAEVGEILAKNWRLPPLCRMAARHHHEPLEAEEEHRVGVRIIHLANFIANHQGFCRMKSGFMDSFDSEAWTDLGLSREDVPEIVRLAVEQGKRSVIFLSNAV